MAYTCCMLCMSLLLMLHLEDNLEYERERGKEGRERERD